MTTTNRPRPTSPRPRPPARGDLTQSTSPLAPLPYGGEVDLRRRHRTDLTPNPARPRGDLRGDLNLLDVRRG